MRTWKVGAITSGILLIAIGLLWFIDQFYDLHLQKYLLFAWPVACILLGSEILFLHFRNRDEKLRFHWLAISFLILMTFVSIGFNAVSVAAEELNFSINKSTYELEQTIAVPADRTVDRVVVNLTDQDVSIVGTDKPEVSIQGNLSANIDDEILLAKEVEDNFSMKLVDRVLYVDLEKANGLNELTDIEGKIFLSVPKTTDVEVNVSDGSIHINDITGQVSLHSNGDITANNINGTMTVNSIGHVQLNQCTLLEGSNITTEYGDLNWTMPNTASATIEASTYGELGGKLSSDVKKEEKEERIKNSKSVQIGDSSIPVFLHSSEGNITVSTTTQTP